MHMRGVKNDYYNIDIIMFNYHNHLMTLQCHCACRLHHQRSEQQMQSHTLNDDTPHHEDISLEVQSSIGVLV